MRLVGIPARRCSPGPVGQTMQTSDPPTAVAVQLYSTHVQYSTNHADQRPNYSSLQKKL